MSLSSALTSFILPGFFLRVLAPSSVRLEFMIYLDMIYTSHSIIKITQTIFTFKPLALHLYQPMHRNILSLQSNKILRSYCRLSHFWFCHAFLLTIHLYLIDTLLFPSIFPLMYLHILPLLSLTSRFPLYNRLSYRIRLSMRAG